MTYYVKNSPIFHRYLASILLKVGLAEGSLSNIMGQVGEYILLNRCTCGDETCCTVRMRSDSLIGKDGAFAFPFNIAWIIINFYKDGGFEVESLADRAESNFPFKQEIQTVLNGGTLEYDGSHAEEVVEEFMDKLVKQEAHRIEV